MRILSRIFFLELLSGEFHTGNREGTWGAVKHSCYSLSGTGKMSKGSVSQSIIEAIDPILKGENLELVDVEYKKAGKSWVLRVFIDKPGGITLGDCQKVSHQIEDKIEVEELVSSAYILEVSSPGLDRPLKNSRDFLRYKGKEVKVHTFVPVNGKKKFSGTIIDFRDNHVHLEMAGKSLAIPLDKISKATLILEI
jgi:ribosome maturation factor RimP